MVLKSILDLFIGDHHQPQMSTSENLTLQISNTKHEEKTFRGELGLNQF